jgi:ankyrin repeat protein
MLTSESGNEEAVRSLLLMMAKKNVGIDAVLTSGVSALGLASRKGHTAVVQMLFINKANTKIQADGQHTALHIGHIHQGVMELLLKHGMDSNNRSDKDEIPFHLAAADGYELVVCLLLEWEGGKVDVQAVNEDSYSALNFAAKGGYEYGVGLLLQFNANVLVDDRDKCTVLHLVAKKGHQVVVRQLLEHHANMAASDSTSRTSLHHAVTWNHISVVVQLLDNDAKILFCDDNNRTPLWHAVHNGHMEVARLLIKEALL